MKSEGLAGLTTVSVDWEEPAVIILDQTQLPNREAYLRLYTPEEIWEAIYHLKVRGAPAIGVAAAYGMAVCAQQFGAEDAAACRSIGEWGLSVLQPGMGLLTHCNAGHLAVSEYGTALAPVYLGQERGYHFKVYADETRPLLQGARLTAFELQKAGAMSL